MVQFQIKHETDKELTYSNGFEMVRSSSAMIINKQFLFYLNSNKKQNI